MHVLISLLLQLQMQAVSPTSAGPAPAVSVERIRRELESPPAAVTTATVDGELPPVFRMEIRERPLNFEQLWKQGAVPAYVRPSRGLYHHEFLEQVTPDLFRGPEVYPCCPVLPLVEFLLDKIAGDGKGAEKKARQDVKAELAKFLKQQKQNERKPDQQ